MPTAGQIEAGREEAPPEQGLFVFRSRPGYGFATIRLSAGTGIPAGSFAPK